VRISAGQRLPQQTPRRGSGAVDSRISVLIWAVVPFGGVNHKRGFVNRNHGGRARVGGLTDEMAFAHAALEIAANAVSETAGLGGAGWVDEADISPHGIRVAVAGGSAERIVLRVCMRSGYAGDGSSDSAKNTLQVPRYSGVQGAMMVAWLPTCPLTSRRSSPGS
jgi:hypothetical protein